MPVASACAQRARDVYHCGSGDKTREERSCMGISYSSTAGKVEIPRTRLINGCEFKLILIANNRNRAKKS
jgi:hypothetical protein